LHGDFMSIRRAKAQSCEPIENKGSEEAIFICQT